MIITAKAYDNGRTALSKAVLDALGVAEGDLVEIRVDGYVTTVPIQSINRITIPSQIREEVGFVKDDLLQIDVGLPQT